jgi:hypothetical protein
MSELQAYLARLGPTNKDRARVLSERTGIAVSASTVQRLMTGYLPRQVRQLLIPDLLRALALDAERTTDLSIPRVNSDADSV